MFDANFLVVSPKQIWIYIVTVMQSDQRDVTIRFADYSLGDSYQASSTLLMKKNLSGNYVVLRRLPDIPGCVASKD